MSKLCTKASKWTAVTPYPQALNHFASDELKITHALQQLGVKVVGIGQIL